ncbi:hypothetical protein, partial [Serratia sp. CY39337]|uniref:hypothetical protein n=1 Tax=Serratia sp. CY39337 TaxID=3383614 RepID=UPI003FA0AA2E
APAPPDAKRGPETAGDAARAGGGAVNGLLNGNNRLEGLDMDMGSSEKSVGLRVLVSASKRIWSLNLYFILFTCFHYSDNL